MIKKYQGRIKNITTGEWVSDETQSECVYTKFKKYACIFDEENDAVSTVEMLNSMKENCFVLIDNK